MRIRVIARPTGTVTFFFTDIQGSTRLWEGHPEAMRAALSRHDQILRQAITSHEGVIVKHQGDGFYAAFSSPKEAVETALAAQRALAAEPWGETGPIRVRAALHTGAAEERDGDYFGVPVNRTARLVDAAHGGQVLLSSATEQLVRHDLPDGTSLRSLGAHRLRDLAHADEIYQLVAPGLTLDFPPLRSLSVRPNNLPVQSTTFLGREQDVTQIRQLLEGAHLVSLIGPGGVGKTRLALEAATYLLDGYEDGVWFVDLAPLSDPELLPNTVIAALSIPEQPGETAEKALLASLRGKNLLLLLDNCEHLIEACARLATLILRTCPRVKLLVTSREPLRLPEEVRWQVQPLAVPDGSAQISREQLADYDAIQLFVDRASAILPSFTNNDQDITWISEIVRNLDGIPLAIELAAARLSVFSLEQIAQKLQNRFQLLRRGSRTALPRQQTLEALIDWSYNLISGEEQILFQRLSVFSGGLTAEAAEEVCAGDGIEAGEVIELLAQLVEKSLVVADKHPGEYRYRLLETLRQYASQRLSVNGDPDQLRARHARYFLALAEGARPGLFSDDHKDSLGQLQAEADNFRAAIEWSRGNDIETGLCLARALWRMWWLSNQVSEGRSQMDRLWSVPHSNVPLELQLESLHARGNLAFRDGDYAEAQTHFKEMRRLSKEAGDLKHEAMAASALGGMLVEQMDYESAAVLLRESLRLEEKVPGMSSNPYIRIDLGLIELGRGEYLEAERLFRESLARAETEGDYLRTAIAHCCLGVTALGKGSPGEGRNHLAMSLKLAFAERFDWMLPVVIESFAGIAVHEHVLVRAVRLASAAKKLREDAGVPLAPLWQQLFDPPLEAAKQQLDPTIWDVAWREGQAMALDQVVDYALSDDETSSG